MEYTVKIQIPSKGQITVKIVANSSAAALAAAKIQGGPGSFCWIVSAKHI